MFDALVERSKDILKSEFGLGKLELDRARRIIRLASLLHDIGHAPFSHSGEALLPPQLDEQGKPVLNESGKVRRITHEMMTVKIILETDIARIINDSNSAMGISPMEVAAVATEFAYLPDYTAKPSDFFLHDLLTGELGADRIDYLLRDALHSGQRSGEFDYRRLAACLTMVPPPEEADPSPSIGFDQGGWLVAEQMIVARYLMYQSLYFHKTKRIYEIHLEQFMCEWLKKEHGQAHLPADLRKYLAISDSDVIAGIHEAGRDESHPGHKAAVRFTNRSHMRLAKELILADNSTGGSRGRRIPLTKRFADLKEYVRLTLGSDDAICDEPDHSATKMFGETDKILVLLDGDARYLDDISEIVSGMAEKIWRGRVYTTPDRREEAKSLCNLWLVDNPVKKYLKS